MLTVMKDEGDPGGTCFRRHDAVVELLANLFHSIGYMEMIMLMLIGAAVGRRPEVMTNISHSLM